MIRPDDIFHQAKRVWDRGAILRAELQGESLFPLEIPFRRPGARELQSKFAELRDWIDELKAGSRAQRGRGYDLEFSETRNRQIGVQSLPVRIYFADREQYLNFIGRASAFASFQRLVDLILSRQPDLKPWLERNGLRALELEAVWDQLLDVCDFLIANPRPNIYLRELALPGIETKFVESHRAVLAAVFDQLLPADAINTAYSGTAGKNFEHRYGFRTEAPRVRFRFLDPRLAARFGGVCDLSMPLGDFARLDPPARRVLITENKTNGLALPARPETIVIFGLGYGVGGLREVAWLRECECYYWGDIDTHGFRMLSQVREFLPAIQSLFMDEDTLLGFRNLWVSEGDSRRCLEDLPGLRPHEQRVYNALRQNEHGDRVRLEQERIAWDRVLERLPE